MGLFKPDLYRNFGIGFAVGALLAVWQVAPGALAEFAPQAHAATLETPAR